MIWAIYGAGFLYALYCVLRSEHDRGFRKGWPIFIAGTLIVVFWFLAFPLAIAYHWPDRKGLSKDGASN